MKLNEYGNVVISKGDLVKAVKDYTTQGVIDKIVYNNKEYFEIVQVDRLLQDSNVDIGLVESIIDEMLVEEVLLKI